MPVVQGDNVFLNEAVQSTADSKANLVLNDNTNVTVGPNSTVRLDDFVYSGPKERGTIALNMTKGTLRFITGDANKRAYTILTPTAAIGVRGTILRIQVTPTETKVINEEGVAIVCHRNGNEHASVEELRKRRCSKAQRAKGLCGCEELLVPNQQATVSQSQIAVTEAPVGAISDPIIAEGLGGGFAAPPLGAVALVLRRGSRCFYCRGDDIERRTHPLLCKPRKSVAGQGARPVPGGEPGSLPKDRRSLPQYRLGGRSRILPPRRPKLFTEKNPTSTRLTLPEGSPLPKSLCAAAALIQARRAKQLSSPYKESSPSLDQRVGAA